MTTNATDARAELDELEAELRRNPRSVHALRRSAELLIAAGRLGEAAERLRAATEAEPNAITYLELADLYLLMKDEEQAATVLEQLLRRNADDLQVYRFVANLWFARGYVGRAAEMFRRSLELEPDNVFDLVGIGTAEYQLGNADAGRRYLDRAISVAPDEMLPRMARGELEMAQQRFEAAAEDFRRAVELNPEFGHGHRRLGDAYFALDEYARAEASLKAGLEISPDDPEMHNTLGLVYEAQRNYSAALAHYRRVADLQPEDAAGHRNIGDALVGLEQYESAIESYSRALKLVEDAAVLWQARGAAYLKLGRYEESLRDYDRAVELNSADADSLIGRAQVYLAQRAFTEAAGDLTSALELSPNSATAYAERAKAHEGNRDLIRAIEDLTAVIRLQPNVASTYFERGRVYIPMRAYDWAVDDFRRAIELGMGRRAMLAQAQALQFSAEIIENNTPIADARRAHDMYAQSAAICDSVIEMTGESALAHGLRGIALAGMGEHLAAVESFDRQIVAGSFDADFVCAKSLALMRAGRAEVGLAVLDTVSRAESPDRMVSITRGLLMLTLGRENDAQSAFDAALVGSDDAERYLARGAMFAKMREWRLASADLRKALNFRSNDPSIQNALAWCHCQTGENIEEGIELARSAVSAFGAEVIARSQAQDTLAWLLRRVGRLNEARSIISKTIDDCNLEFEIRLHAELIEQQWQESNTVAKALE